MLKIVKKEDGFWLVIETEGKQAMINLGFPKNIVGEVVAEAAQQSVQRTGLTVPVKVVVPWRRFLSWLVRAFTASR